MISYRNIFLFIFILLIYKFINSNVTEHLKIIDLKKNGYHRCKSYPIGKINNEVLLNRGQMKNNKD